MSSDSSDTYMYHWYQKTYMSTLDILTVLTVTAKTLWMNCHSHKWIPKHVIRTGQIKLDKDYYLFIMVEF